LPAGREGFLGVIRSADSQGWQRRVCYRLLVLNAGPG
jgi:hypothetical protein